MCKFYCHFGLRSILILFMIGSLSAGEGHAFGVSALFCALIELGAIAGGYLADKHLGLVRATRWGAFLMMCGYLGVGLPGGVYPALGVIIVGSSLFSSNVIALYGSTFQESGKERSKGFSQLYRMQNLGALVGTLVVGLIASQYGFVAGFVSAGMGMVAVNILLLPINEEKSVNSLIGFLLVAGVVVAAMLCKYQTLVYPFIPLLVIVVLAGYARALLQDSTLDQKEVKRLLVYLLAIVCFFAVEDQICSTLIVYSEHYAGREILGYAIPSGMIMLFNPIVIILFGGLMGARHHRIRAPFLLCSLAFAIMGMVALIQLTTPIVVVIGVVCVISIAELMLGPQVFSQASRVGKGSKAGFIMGGVPLAFSLAFLSGGFAGKLIAFDSEKALEHSYGAAFLILSALLIMVSILLEGLLKGRRQIASVGR